MRPKSDNLDFNYQIHESFEVSMLFSISVCQEHMYSSLHVAVPASTEARWASQTSYLSLLTEISHIGSDKECSPCARAVDRGLRLDAARGVPVESVGSDGKLTS
jgi:hypothetical protein